MPAPTLLWGHHQPSHLHTYLVGEVSDLQGIGLASVGEVQAVVIFRGEQAVLETLLGGVTGKGLLRTQEKTGRVKKREQWLAVWKERGPHGEWPGLGEDGRFRMGIAFSVQRARATPRAAPAWATSAPGQGL